MQNRDLKRKRKMYEERKHMAKLMQGNAQMQMVQGEERGLTERGAYQTGYM
jgi:hypothetical protein